MQDDDVTGDTIQGDTGPGPVVRQQDFPCDGPVDMSIEVGAGQVDVRLVEDPAGTGTGIAVQVRPDPSGQSPWSGGLGSLLSWLGDQTGASGPADLGAEAARRTLIEFADGRLTVRTPKDLPLRSVPLSVQVSAPSGSTVSVRTGSADLTVDGVAARLDLGTGSGDVRAQRCTGAVEVRTGSGDVRLGSVLGALQARSGSGEIDVVAVEGPASVQTGTGDVRLGSVATDATVRTGSGDLTIGDASAGLVDLTTGSGELRVGIHEGVLAEVDVSSGSGRARSDLPVGDPPPAGATQAEGALTKGAQSGDVQAALRVRGRTGSGDALVTRGGR